MNGQKAYLSAKKIHERLLEYPNKMDAQARNKAYKEYLSLIRKAAYSGYLEAQYDLAQQHETMSFLGLKNPMFNPIKRIYWYSKACQRNHPQALGGS